MKHTLLLVSALAIGVFGTAAAIGWAATSGSDHGAMMTGTTMHSPKAMRSQMQAVHPGLSKATLDRIVAECQRAGEDGTTMSGMMGDDGTMDDWTHHSGDTTKHGMMDDGMMG